jgi:hypothetical protein
LFCNIFGELDLCFERSLGKSVIVALPEGEIFRGNSWVLKNCNEKCFKFASKRKGVWGLEMVLNKYVISNK